MGVTESFTSDQGLFILSVRKSFEKEQKPKQPKQ